MQVENDSSLASVKPRVANILGHIEPYVLGDDYADYMERMDSVIELNGIEGNRRANFCIASCGPDLYKIIKTCVAPKEIKDVDYTTMKKAIKAYFDPLKNVIAERYKFHKRERNADESISDFIVEIKSLSQTCDFKDFLDNALRDKLVCGANHDRVQAKLLSESTLTFEEACKIAKGIETTSQDLSTLKGDAQVNKLGVFSRSRLGPRSEYNRSEKKKQICKLSMLCMLSIWAHR